MKGYNYSRRCKRCDFVYHTPHKESVVCFACDKRPPALKTRLRGEFDADAFLTFVFAASLIILFAWLALNFATYAL